MVLSLGHGYLLSRSGPNDGLSRSRSTTGRQVNWFGTGFDALAYYAQLADCEC